MIPGKAATAFSARRFKASDKCLSLFLTHSRILFLSFGAPPPFPPPVSETTIVEMIVPIAMSIAIIAIPCSLHMILGFSAREVSLSKILAMVSLILESWLRSSFLFCERISSLASCSVSALSIFLLIISFSSSEYVELSLISSSFP